MAARDVNIMFRCEDCTFADEYGRGCKHSLLFPVLLLMANKQSCPNYKDKTREQIEEQLRLREYECNRLRDREVLR